MLQDYGIALIHKGPLKVQKPFIFDKVMRKGANKGKVRVWLTRGRAADGSIIKGTRVYVHPRDIIECPPDLVLEIK